ncbi:hypothetical protein FGG08_006644 [Glutinoglossum americanum]|uniref:Uncharacterized protein n=1 Tax=Glutinoglossum americanum TaxID=1670608 RepID=A0A9P8I137_9PEZI|nr:hypothetical protein FGG08_006644 [Glutinoglossum americanum]
MLRDLKYAEAELLGREFSCRVCQKPLDSQDSQDKIFHVDGHYLGNSSQPKGNQPKGDRAEGDHSKDDQLKDNQSKSNQAKGVIKSSPRDASRRRRLRRNERHDRMRRLPHVAAEEESERGRPAEKLPTFECFFCHIVFKDRGMALDRQSKSQGQEIMNHYKVHFREHAASKRAAEDGSAVNPAKRQKPTGSEEERHCPRCWSSVEALGGEGRAFHKNSCFVLGEWVVLPAHAGRLKRAAYLDDKSAKQETIERGRRSKAHCSRCFRLFDLATTQEKDAHRTECGSLYQPWVYLDLREGRKRRALFLASEDNYDCIPEDEGPNGTSPVVSERFGAQLHCPVCYTYVQRMDEKARYAHGLKCGVSGPWYKTTIEYGRQRRLELGLEEGQTCPICFLDVAKKDYEWKKLHKIHCGGARRKWLYLKPEEANAKREHYLMMKEAQRDFVRRYCDWCYTCVHSLGKIKEQKHLRDCDAQSVMLSKGTAEGLRAHFLGKASTQDGINEDDGIKSSISGQADAGISGSESSETRASRERAVYGEPVGPSSDEDLALEEPESPGVAPQPSQLPTPSDLTSPRNAKLGGDDSADVDGGEGEEGEDDGTNPGEGGTKLQQFPDPVREVTSWELSDSDSNGSLPSRDWRPMMSLSKEELYKKAGLLHLLKKGEEVKGKGRA